MSEQYEEAVRNKERGKHHRPMFADAPRWTPDVQAACRYVVRDVEWLLLSSLAPGDGCRRCYAKEA